MSAGNEARPVLVCLHFLGGSAKSWRPVTDLLAGTFRCINLDLPGFGEAADIPGYALAQMADGVAHAVTDAAPARWILAGHSMGAKIAALVASRAEAGDAGLTGLAGLAMVAGSPPGPEPMPESKRQTMLGWFQGDAAQSQGQAREYIDQNSTDLAPTLQDHAIQDVLGANRSAWDHWLAHASREDVSGTVGTLRTQAVVIAGEADEALGPDAQRRLMMPHFEHAEFIGIPGAKHLLPLERPHDIARILGGHFS